MCIKKTKQQNNKEKHKFLAKLIILLSIYLYDVSIYALVSETKTKQNTISCFNSHLEFDYNKKIKIIFSNKTTL